MTTTETTDERAASLARHFPKGTPDLILLANSIPGVAGAILLPDGMLEVTAASLGARRGVTVERLADILADAIESAGLVKAGRLHIVVSPLKTEAGACADRFVDPTRRQMTLAGLETFGKVKARLAAATPPAHNAPLVVKTDLSLAGTDHADEATADAFLLSQAIEPFGGHFAGATYRPSAPSASVMGGLLLVVPTNRDVGDPAALAGEIAKAIEAEIPLAKDLFVDVQTTAVATARRRQVEAQPA